MAQEPAESESDKIDRLAVELRQINALIDRNEWHDYVPNALFQALLASRETGSKIAFQYAGDSSDLVRHAAAGAIALAKPNEGVEALLVCAARDGGIQFRYFKDISWKDVAEDRRTASSETLIKFMQQGSESAAKVLGNIGDPALTGSLRDVLSSYQQGTLPLSDERRRDFRSKVQNPHELNPGGGGEYELSLRMALAKLGDPNEIDYFAARLYSPNVRVVESAIERIGYIGQPSLLRRVTEFLTDDRRWEDSGQTCTPRPPVWLIALAAMREANKDVPGAPNRREFPDPQVEAVKWREWWEKRSAENPHQGAPDHQQPEPRNDGVPRPDGQKEESPLESDHHNDPDRGGPLITPNVEPSDPKRTSDQWPDWETTIALTLVIVILSIFCARFAWTRKSGKSGRPRP